MKKTGVSLKTMARRIFLLLLLLAFSRSQQAGAQTNNPSTADSGCGVFQKLGGIPESYGGELYYDRFGNTWMEDEISGLALNVEQECTAGVFQLSFSGDYLDDERLQVCAAFDYLSTIVGGGAGAGIVPLKIEFVPDLGGAAAAASQFMQADCGLMRNFALSNIRTQSNQLPIGFSAGLVQISDIVKAKWF